MLVRFSSVNAESITMFGDVAVQLIKMLGASGSVPGAIGAEDIPAAVKRLRQELHTQAVQHTGPESAVRDEPDNEYQEPPVALTTRAGPLIDLLARAGAANASVMWEVG